MSQTNDICPKCTKPRSPNHTLAGFRADGMPQYTCHRDARLGPDPLLEGVNLLWNLMKTAQNATTAHAGKLERKTSDHQTALTLIENHELSNKQLEAKIDQLRKDLAKAKAEKVDAVTEAVKEIEKDMGAELKQAQKDLERLSNEYAEKLTFKENCLAQIEASLAKIGKTAQDLETKLKAADIVVRDAKTEAISAAAQRDTLAENLKIRNLEFGLLGRGNLSLSIRVGLLEGRLDRYEVLYGPLPAETVGPEDVLEEKDAESKEEVIDLDQLTPASKVKETMVGSVRAAHKVVAGGNPAHCIPPAGKMQDAHQMVVAAAEATPAVPPAAPKAPSPVPAPVAAPQADTCMCCDKPAVKISAKDALALKAGGFYDQILSCKYPASHLEDIQTVLEDMRDQFVDLPSDSNELLQRLKFTTINPNV